MSLRIYFQPTRYSGTPVIRKNPFTGQEITAFPTLPLPGSQQRAIRQVLSKYSGKAEQTDAEEFLMVTFGAGAYKGSLIEIDLCNLAQGCPIVIRGDSPELYPFLYELLQGADWMLIASQEDILAIVVSFDRLEKVPPSSMPIVECRSPEQLASFLSKGIQDAEAYRGQVSES